MLLHAGWPSDLVLVVWSLLIIGAMIGLRHLLPWETLWLRSGDPAVHQIGWEFFRRAPWAWPLGFFTEYSDNNGISIVYTDSIPIAAILLKAFVPRSIPEFQYLGIWLLLSSFLMGFFARRLALNFTHDRILALLVAMFVAISPPALFRLAERAAEHYALTAHWMLVAIIYLATLREGRCAPHRGILMAGTVILAAGVHFYLFVVAASLLATVLLVDCMTGRRRWPTLAGLSASTLLGAFAFMYALGYFVFPLSVGRDIGFGDYSMNGLALFNPLSHSLLVGPLPLLTPGQYEGFAYAGLGSLILLPALFVPASKAGGRTSPVIVGTLGLYCLAMLLLASMPRTAVGDIVLLDLSRFQKDLEIVFGFVRANGRLFWGAYYIIVLALLYRLMRADIGRSAKLGWIGLAILVQCADLWQMRTNAVQRVARVEAAAQELTSPGWADLAARYRSIKMLPRLTPTEDYIPFARLAFLHDMTTNAGRLGRTDRARIIREEQELTYGFQEGRLDRDSLYVLTDTSLLDSASLPPGVTGMGRLDGYLVVAPEWFSTAEHPKVEEIRPFARKPAPPVSLATPVLMKDAGSRRFLGAGWHRTEPAFGVWSYATSSRMTMHVPQEAQRLDLVGHVLLSETVKPRAEVTVNVNGVVAGNATVAWPRIYNNRISVALPACPNTAGCDLDIEIVTPNIMSPAALGMRGNDQRPIGFGLVSFEVR